MANVTGFSQFQTHNKWTGSTYESKAFIRGSLIYRLVLPPRNLTSPTEWLILCQDGSQALGIWTILGHHWLCWCRFPTDQIQCRTISICVHLSEDLLCAFFRRRLIFRHFHHRRHHFIDRLWREGDGAIMSQSILWGLSEQDTSPVHKLDQSQLLH